MREEFEKWYISKFLRIMLDAENVVTELRNNHGGYDDQHIDGAWECWKFKRDNTCATCKHWGDYSDYPSSIKVGKCNKVQNYWESVKLKEIDDDYVRILINKDNKAFVQDADGYSAYLLTVAEFGCVQHEKIV